MIVDQRQILKILENCITIRDKYWKYWRIVLLSSTLTCAPENLKVNPEEEVDADEKGPYVFQIEMEKAVKKVRD